jgi:hypothetical protein
MTRALLWQKSRTGMTTCAIDGTSELRRRVQAAACLQGQTDAANLRDLIGHPLSAEEGAPS